MSFSAWYPDRVRSLVIVDARPSIPDDRLVLMHRRGQRPLRHHATIEDAVKAFRLLPRETVADPELLEHMAREGVVERDGGWSTALTPRPTPPGNLSMRGRSFTASRPRRSSLEPPCRRS
jgi:hypothetical protein